MTAVATSAPVGVPSNVPTFQVTGDAAVAAHFASPSEVPGAASVSRLPADSNPTGPHQHEDHYNDTVNSAVHQSEQASTQHKRKYVKRLVPVTTDSPASNTRSKSKLL